MTEIFHYENLTWPEVAELPRDVPLVLPLGSSFDSEKVAAQLGHPQRLGILPSIPFGWRGSGLAVPEPLLNFCLTKGIDARILPINKARG